MSAALTQKSYGAAAWGVLVLAGLAVAALCVHLWPEWLQNPDLSHGLFAPALFGLLIFEGRRRGSMRHPADTAWRRGIRAAVLVFGVAGVIIAGLYSVAIDWTHPLVDFSLAIGVAALLLGALLWLSIGSVRVLPLNWPTVLAAGLWPLCAPIPPGTYARLTIQLQLWVTQLVLEALHLLGIAASTAGNVILLAHTSVGVEEACSGVRSLFSCLVAALFFSAVWVRKPWARLLLIALAPMLAFGMNIVRSLTLTLLANAGVDIGGAWHDLTGFAVLGTTSLILGGLALLLEEQPAAEDQMRMPTGHPGRAATPWGLLSAYVLAGALVAFFAFHTRSPVRNEVATPNLAAILPSGPASWDVVHTENLYQFTPVLKTEHLMQRTYVRAATTTAGGDPVQITVYLAYWEPDRVPVSLVAMHTPEACWPGSGWISEARAPSEQPFTVGQRTLSPPEYRRFSQAGLSQNVWYWHLYAGRSITQLNPYSAPALLSFAWRYGFRAGGPQWFVRVSSNRPWGDIREEPLLAEIIDQLQPHGL